MSEIVLFIDELKSSSSISICRICHEEEFESCKSLETPCACSGTVKFFDSIVEFLFFSLRTEIACRDGAMKKATQRVKFAYRESLGVPRNEQEQENPGVVLETEDYESEYAADTSGSCCRSMALIFTALLLIRHLFAVVTGGAGSYPFSLLTVLIVKASGIILPMYILLRISAALHNSIRHHYQLAFKIGEFNANRHN
ncbi:hypothetical protein DH2020_048104 [Rehmannia glutinosa]|uniref:RING-CH-type domain-containing protein n=1 Tax=Rehmannia glutinosa TaxID=99300 RepID=A0ABR0U7M3_REHGL